MDPETIYVFEDWACMVRCLNEAIEDGELDLFLHCLHTGGMAILVDGIPRVIDGQVH
jgi:hypothetical protein